MPNTRWTSEDKDFIVERVNQDDTGIWVFYFNEKTHQKYSCLIDSFTARFREDVQYRKF